MTDLVVTSNSPGEVASWVRVAVRAVKRRRPDLRVVLALVPCPFASGAEAEVARSLPGVDLVLTPGQSTALALGLPSAYRPSPRGLVLYLGGELWHALLLARRLGYPSLAYLVRDSFWSGFFHSLALMRPGLRVRSGQRARWVGDLMVDSFEAQVVPELGLDPDRPILGLFPGSRELHLRFSLVVFLAVAEHLARKLPELQFLLALSPFLREGAVQRALSRPFFLGLESSTGELQSGQLITRAGLPIHLVKGRPGQPMPRMDVALTIPGTNTAELACSGTPFVVAMHPGANLGWGGLSGLLERLPVGPAVRRHINQRRYRRARHSAHPNQRAGRRIVPEVMLGGSLGHLEEELWRLLRDPAARERTSRELKHAMGGSGAADRLADWVEEALA